MPSKYDNDDKTEARDWVVAGFRKHFGHSIPVGRHYLTLCNTQPQVGSELTQLRDAGLLTPNQFVGVDKDSILIEENHRWHPESTWYCGDYLSFLHMGFHLINPALIYLDTTSTAASAKLLTMTIDTMHRCQRDTVLTVNVMLNNPAYNNERWDSNFFVNALSRKMTKSEHGRWFNADFQYKPYQAHSAVMAQYMFISR